jgi:hypothetical protein
MAASPPTRRSKGDGPGTGVAMKVQSSRLSAKLVLRFAGSSETLATSTLKLIVRLGFTTIENAKGTSAGSCWGTSRNGLLEEFQTLAD